MNTQQITLVQQSFERLRPISHQAGELFYQNLFDMAPQVKRMFKTPVAEQAGKLMYTLAYVVTHLHTPETILDDVRKLAIRHIEYGTRPEHYEVVGAALLKTLEQGLGEQWNDDLKEAWTLAFAMIAEAMIEATTSFEKQAA